MKICQRRETGQKREAEFTHRLTTQNYNIYSPPRWNDFAVNRWNKSYLISNMWKHIHKTLDLKNHLVQFYHFIDGETRIPENSNCLHKVFLHIAKLFTFQVVTVPGKCSLIFIKTRLKRAITVLVSKKKITC